MLCADCYVHGIPIVWNLSPLSCVVHEETGSQRESLREETDCVDGAVNESVECDSPLIFVKTSVEYLSVLTDI